MQSLETTSFQVTDTRLRNRQQGRFRSGRQGNQGVEVEVVVVPVGDEHQREAGPEFGGRVEALDAVAEVRVEQHQPGVRPAEREAGVVQTPDGQRPCRNPELLQVVHEQILTAL